jgi:hypothetical protein
MIWAATVVATVTVVATDALGSRTQAPARDTHVDVRIAAFVVGCAPGAAFVAGAVAAEQVVAV